MVRIRTTHINTQALSFDIRESTLKEAIEEAERLYREHYGVNDWLRPGRLVPQGQGSYQFWVRTAQEGQAERVGPTAFVW